MVLFYSLSGLNWVRKDGFGSSKHEYDSLTSVALQFPRSNLEGWLSNEIAHLLDLKN